jgi:hypothetical protein
VGGESWEPGDEGVGGAVNAVGMLVRTAGRRYWRASVFLVVVAALAAGVVGAAFQAASRADTSLERFRSESRVYDQFAAGCPPGVDPEQSGAAACTTPEVTEQFRKVLARVPGVERSTGGATLVVGVADPTVSNGWGRITLMNVTTTPGAPLAGRPIVVQGRLPDPAAPDEIVMTEKNARVGGFHAGDEVEIGGWPQEHLDAAIDGSLAPETPRFRSRVVGIVRTLSDAQPDTGFGSDPLSDGSMPGEIGAGPAWYAAHGTGLSGYGITALVRLRDGQRGIPAFERRLAAGPDGWFATSGSLEDQSPTSVQRVIDLERRAVFVFCAIAVVAGVAFVGLTAMRQLRREAAESPGLTALGMTRRDLRLVNVTRALTMAVPAAILAVVVVVALSPLGPVGLARRLEFDLGVRVDLPVLVLTALAVVALFVAVALLTPVGALAATAPRRVRPSWLDPLVRPLGPVPAVSAVVSRGRSSRVVVTVVALSVGAAVAAGGLVASFDRVIDEPVRYGGWWDVAVGEYSDQGPLDEGIAKLKANPAVQVAAGADSQSDVAKVDGQNVPLFAWNDYVGHARNVLVAGRAPESDDEVTLGRDTARSLDKGVGDEIRVRNRAGDTIRLRVVGEGLFNDPVADSTAVGKGALLTPATIRRVAGESGVSQSIAIRIDPRADRAAAVRALQRDFPGSIRAVRPGSDLQNVSRLHAVPWLIAALVGALALATLVHALVTLLGRHRSTLAVASAMGFTRGQRRQVGVLAGTGLVAVGVVIGIPVGILVGARVWRSVADSVGVPSGPVVAWLVVVTATVAALAVATAVAVIATRGAARMSPAELLRVE